MSDRPTIDSATALSVVMVTHDSAAALSRSLPAIVSELRHGDELIVCDNASCDETRTVVAELAPTATLIANLANVGFGAACNLGAERASAELLLFLNPDNVVAEGFRGAIELPLLDHRNWAAWQGLVTDEGGRLLNSAGGVVHFTGVAWAGGAGETVGSAPSDPEPVAFPSGACLAIRGEVWRELGGFSESYFLYHEDTDLGLRLHLAGHEVGIEPRAISDHEYDFDKGSAKWLYLERNRWATIVRTYPGRLLALLMPGLLATELVLLAAAAAGGWLPEKLRANAQALGGLPRLRRERGPIQGAARIDAAAFAAHLVPALDSAYLGRAAESAALRRLLAAYWRLVVRLL